MSNQPDTLTTPAWRDLPDQLRGWREVDGMSDDARRKLWLMRKAADEIERLNTPNTEMEKALRLIIECRGICGACGADCDGPGEGITPYPCPRGYDAPANERYRECVWAPPDYAARARKGLGL